MLKRYAQLAGLTLLLGVLSVPAAHASTRISVRIGPSVPFAAPVAVVPGPRPGWAWRPGHYVRYGYRRHWVPGTWVRVSFGPVYGSRWSGARYYGRDRRIYYGDRWVGRNDGRYDRAYWRR